MSKEKKESELRKLAKLLAKLKTGWWKSHHEKDWVGTIRLMAQLYVKLYKVSFEIAEKIVDFRVEAAREHDLAEKPGISKEKSDEHWRNAEKLNEKHFFMLEKHRQR